MEKNVFEKGGIIFREGDPGESMLEVYTGKVGVYSGYKTPEEKLLMEYYPDDYFGEMGLIDHAPRSATAVAMEDNTSLGEITEDGFAEFFRANPSRVLMVMQQLSHNLRNRTNEYLKVCHEIHELAEKEGLK
ncbi:MAG: cyclic nucleotide-binding domain-containing protein [Oscillospiraceae bacterium]|nr:cyclic nucleotide-binding domain-containing protein [Oscillospiraceae bacterium]